MIKTSVEITKIRQAGKILAQVAKIVLARAEEGIQLKDLDSLVLGMGVEI